MSFQDIKGHDNLVRCFKRELELKRISPAYLLFGPSGVGKTLFAHILSKALNCIVKEDDACEECVSCLKIEHKIHPDVLWLEAEEKKESIGIGQIREMQGKINLRPYEGKRKIFIIQDSHLMKQDAANCLLKTLEEPPPNSVIILISSNPEGLLSTIRSRCRQIRFNPLEIKLRRELSQKQGLSSEGALFLSKLANSGFYRPWGSEGKDILSYKNRILDEFGSGDILLDEKSFLFNEPKKGLKFICSVLESWFRDILVFKSTQDASLMINFDRVEELKGLKEIFSYEGLEGVLEEIENTTFSIDRNVSPKITLNNLKMRIAETAR